MVNSKYKNMSFVTCFCFWCPGARESLFEIWPGPAGPEASELGSRPEASGRFYWFKFRK